MKIILKYISWLIVGLWISFLFFPVLFIAVDILNKINIFQALTSIIERGDILNSIKISFITSFLCAFISTVIAFVSAYYINRWHSNKKIIYLIIVYLPIFVPVLPLAIGAKSGISLAGISGNWLIPPLFQVTLSAPFAFAVLYYHLSFLPYSLELVAANFGANKLIIMKDIILPLLLPSFVIAFGVSFLISWDEGIYSWVLSGFDSSFPVLIQEKLWSAKDESVILSSVFLTVIAYIILVFLLAAQQQTISKKNS